MNLARMNYEETGGRGVVMDSAIKEFSTARLNQTELIFLMPMSRIGRGYGNAAAELKTGHSIKPPNAYLFPGVTFSHV